ncbi:hypothetical protein A1353_19065 [Methylomonas methanica]|uniref:Uncharacterized protein n=1 Tax=Methylomonas methanica TaxID=421 RepID=A0A177M5J7_METMH|nr:hypothetical protein [Methylomonas methanica]OAI00911.1 hypothetical protein A1353_19065 [Methylomonas methanica]
MNSKITLLTTIVLTAAATAGGTYYLTTSTRPDSTGESTPVSTLETQPTDENPVQVAVNQDPDKPITIIVKTEVAEKHHGLTEKQIGHIRDLKQPHYGVTQAPTIPLNH